MKHEFYYYHVDNLLRNTEKQHHVRYGKNTHT